MSLKSLVEAAACLRSRRGNEAQKAAFFKRPLNRDQSLLTSAATLQAGSEIPATGLRAFVFLAQPQDRYRVGRTLRSLRSAGIEAEAIGLGTEAGLRRVFEASAPGLDAGTLLVRAGAWLAAGRRFQAPCSSATGKGLCALGGVRPAPAGDGSAVVGDRARAWEAWQGRTGGDFAAISDASALAALAPPCLFLDAIASSELAREGVDSVGEILQTAYRRFRLVHFGPLDVFEDSGLRVLQLITALQRGGAERMTLGLLAELRGLGVRVRLATLGRALREAFPTPPGTLEVANEAKRFGSRGQALWSRAVEFGADVVHGHLITGEDACRLSEAGMPVMLTVHNTRAGWPAGMAELEAGDAALLVACSQAVEAELRQARLPIPVRTVRNGIDLGEFRPTAERVSAGLGWRERWGFAARDFVLIAVANPRPQKRLHLLPGVLAALQAELGSTRKARLVLCGEAAPGHAEAEESVARVRAEVARLGLESSVRWTGSVADVAEVLAAADVLVSASAHEGLSLAQLEALAMGCQVVATDVGGAREIDQVHLVPPEASARQFAGVLARLANAATAPRTSVAPVAHWSRRQMAARYRWLYRRVIESSRKFGVEPGECKRPESGVWGAAEPPAFSAPGSPRGVWLITNNFSTGGAQSSARRLLLGIAARGMAARAAVVEENPDHPTPGRRALTEAGIAVVAVPLDVSDPLTSVARILEAIDRDPPEAVLFWNLRPAFKVWLAEALLDVPVFDVSPGEMYFDSLARFFANGSTASPYRTAREYGARLQGVIVKYQAEARQAREVLGAPVQVVPNGVPLQPSRNRTRAGRTEAGSPARLEALTDGAGMSRPRVTAAGDETFPPQEAPVRLVFGTAARLSPQKRLEDLLEAFQFAHPTLPCYTLRIAGGTECGGEDYAARLRNLAEGLSVEWLGEVTDPAAFHRQLDVFVMISEPAGCPNASLEAMASGLPVIATNVGGASEQVVDGQTGRLVPPRDAGALAAALLELASEPELRIRLGAAARARIGERFSLERMVNDYWRVCLGRPGQPAGEGLGATTLPLTPCLP